MIEVRNVCKAFDEIKAIDHATTKIMEGQIFGLVGSNGAGKEYISQNAKRGIKG